MSKKQEYDRKRYRENQSRILNRQNEYYRATRDYRKMIREREEMLEPELAESKKAAYLAYQKSYYERNKEAIRRRRAEKRRADPNYKG